MMDTSFVVTHVLERKHAMLVLRRKVGEAVIIGHEIRVMVLAVEGERVKIGFQAPSGVNIVREELLFSVSGEGANTAPERSLPERS